MICALVLQSKTIHRRMKARLYIKVEGGCKSKIRIGQTQIVCTYNLEHKKTSGSFFFPQIHALSTNTITAYPKSGMDHKEDESQLDFIVKGKPASGEGYDTREKCVAPSSFSSSSSSSSSSLFVPEDKIVHHGLAYRKEPKHSPVIHPACLSGKGKGIERHSLS